MAFFKGRYFLGERSFFFFCFFPPFFFVWFLVGTVELHRAPFDLSEAERELVSVFNTDYRSFGFVLIFVSEYANVLFFGIFTRIIWVSRYFFEFFFVGLLFVVIILFFRAAYPRVKYDDLMKFC